MHTCAYGQPFVVESSDLDACPPQAGSGGAMQERVQRLYREVAALELGLAAAELGGGAREDHRALAEHEHLIADAQGHPRVLLDEQDGHPARLEADHRSEE